MKILPMSNTHNYKKTSFRSIACDYKLNGEEMGLYTWMFREDINWLELAKYEAENFKNKDKVNIIQFASSDGSEGYTKILSHLITNPYEAEKFLPIQAYDINERVVAFANTNSLKLSGADIKHLIEKGANIIRNFPGAMEFYQQLKTKNLKLDNTSVFQVSEDLTKRIKFNSGDMFEVLPSIKDESNTILMVRNCLGYYTKATVRNFVKTASNVLKNDSLLVVGDLEDMFGTKGTLCKLGFKECLKNVYKKL